MRRLRREADVGAAEGVHGAARRLASDVPGVPAAAGVASRLPGEGAPMTNAVVICGVLAAMLCVVVLLMLR